MVTGTIDTHNQSEAAMPELNDRPLGTSQEHKVLYAVQQTGSRLVGDRFLADYLADCLKMVCGLGELHKLLLATEGQKRGAPPETIAALVEQADDTIRRAAQMQEEDYHQINVLAFLSLWAAHESGIENIVAAAVGTVESVARSAAERLKIPASDLEAWPWPDERCLNIAKLLESKTARKNGWDSANRLTTLFGWLGATVVIPATTSKTLNEASAVRNVLLHRYGRLEPSDVARRPHLATGNNNAVQITRGRLSAYSQAVNDTNVAIMHGVVAAGWK